MEGTGLPGGLLTVALVPKVPPSTYYIPNFITRREEDHLLEKVSEILLLLGNRRHLKPSLWNSTKILKS